eukprot:scaffold222740_cov66-Attheya_sp.AAC.1
MVLVYRETAHSFGGATDTGVQKVTIFMLVDTPSVPGDARDQTGTESAGGGGMGGDAKAADAATTPLSLSSATEHITSKSIRESMNKPFVRIPSPCGCPDVLAISSIIILYSGIV